MECLRSIEEMTRGLKYEVIVADNDPSGGLCDLLNAKSCLDDCHRIEYLGLSDNLGFGGANNEAFKIARGKFLFCLNPDTLLVNNAIKILCDYMEGHPECGACGGNLYKEDNKRALSMRRILPGVFWEISERFKLHPERVRFGRNTRFNHTGKPMDVGYISGADLMLRKEMIDKIGGFSPDFFMYFEETDLCARVHRAGYRVVSVPDAKIIHLEGKSFKEMEINEVKLKYYEESRIAYYRRNVSKELAFKAHKIYLKGLLTECRRSDKRGKIAFLRLKFALETMKGSDFGWSSIGETDRPLNNGLQD